MIKRWTVRKAQPALDLLLAVLLILGIFSASGCQSEEKRAAKERIVQGAARLEALEAQDAALVTQKLNALQQKREEERKKAEEEQKQQEAQTGATDPEPEAEPEEGPEDLQIRAQLLRAGEEDVWKEFRDYVVMGDSRAVGFSWYEYLDSTRVFAENGGTIYDIEDQLDTLIRMAPEKIFLCYGLNDMGYWSDAEEYASALGRAVALLEDSLPNACVVVSSIIPVQESAFEDDENWRNLEEWNRVIRDHCYQNGIRYADNETICRNHSDWWEPDGVHVQPAFYPCWAAELIIASWENNNE